jgi:hypothetical protein
MPTDFSSSFHRLKDYFSDNLVKKISAPVKIESDLSKDRKLKAPRRAYG